MWPKCLHLSLGLDCFNQCQMLMIYFFEQYLRHQFEAFGHNLGKPRVWNFWVEKGSTFKNPWHWPLRQCYPVINLLEFLALILDSWKRYSKLPITISYTLAGSDTLHCNLWNCARSPPINNFLADGLWQNSKKVDWNFQKAYLLTIGIWSFLQEAETLKHDNPYWIWTSNKMCIYVIFTRGKMIQVD